MKRIFLFQLFLLSFLCFSSCSKSEQNASPEHITIAIYDGTPQLEHFTRLLTREWEKAGHKEELRVVPWDNYDGMPDEDASLLIYDGVFYSALRAEGILQPVVSVPEHCSFDWTYTLPDGDAYAEPFLLCSSFLIFDKDDAVLSKARYVTDVTQEVALPLSSMCTYYYIGNMMAKEGPSALMKDMRGEIDETSIAPVRHMADNWLGSVKFENASLSRYDGPARFNGGSVNAVFNFSETSYNLSSKNLTATLLDPFPDVVNRAFNVDYMSVRNGIPESGAKLCEELISIISSEEFQYEYADNGGNALYCLPANKSAFSRLADKYSLYADFFKYSSSETNRPMVMGPGFYDEQSDLVQKIKSLFRSSEP